MEVLNSQGEIYPNKVGKSYKDFGLGGLLFLTDSLIQLHRAVIRVTDLVEISADIQKENPNYHIKFYEGEIYTVSHLIKLYVVTQSPQIPLILSSYVNRKTKTRSIQRIQSLAKDLNLDIEKIVNITGRVHRSHKQDFNIYDLEKIARHWLTLSTPALEFLRTTHVEHRQEIFEVHTKLFENGVVTHAFKWQKQQVFIALHRLKKQYAVALDYGDNLMHDTVIEAALKNNKLYQAEQPEAIELGEYTKVNLAGDFYLGEWYSRRRVNRKIKDYYTEEGAAYCYAKIKELFPKDELNIVNSESSVVDFNKTKSPYSDNKKFILDANPSKLFEAFQDLNIKAVLLANNHSYDFGQNGLRQSLRYFDKAALPFIGVGQDLKNSLNYFKVSAGKRNLYIFSAYWYRGNQYFSYDCYAKPNKSGVASINHFLFQTIQNIKSEDPKAFVLVSPHWGIDFKPTSAHQRNLARQLIHAGTDLIIGHGAHSLQSIEKINDKYVVFSLGNFVFNSDGEFDKHNAPKYGLFAQLDFSSHPKLILKGLDADNFSTKFQPTLVNEEQFEAILKYYLPAIESGILQVDRKNLVLTILL